MTEKRFYSEYYTVGYYTEIVDNEKELDSSLDNPSKRLLINECVDLLNKLVDENEELKQFKEDVFNKIDMHLRMLPTARDNEFNEDDGDPSLYTGAIYMLETLKKELEE